jgi:3-oxoacyl-[acyl-carrier protein] reductase
MSNVLDMCVKHNEERSTMFDFKGKTVVITGGSRGIGFEVAKGVVEGGGHVVILSRTEGNGHAAVEKLGAANADWYQVDLGDHESIDATMDKVFADFDRIDVCVNSGGVIAKSKFEDVSYDEWERTIRVNLTGTFAVCSKVYKYFMAKGGGRIVNVSSVAGKIGGGLLGTAAYASSKAGVNGLTKALAKEGGKYHISANAVCPSFTHTEMTKDLSADPDKNARVIAMIPLGRPAEASEPAQMILFFASEAASFVNGEIGDCDGGIVLD